VRRPLSIVGAALLIAATAAPGRACNADCGRDGVVSVGDLISAVNIALGNSELTQCPAADTDGDGRVPINELLKAVRAALEGMDGVICTVAGTGRAQFDADGGAALQTSLYYPIDVELDAQGRALILDWNNLRLLRLNADGTVTRIMGLQDIEDFPVDGALASETPLHHTSDIELDGGGNLYLAGDHVPVVFRVGTDERVFTVAGTQSFGYSGDGGPATAAELTTPFGILPDAAGGFFVSDVDQHVVRYVAAGGIITTVAGTGTRGYSGDGGPGSAALLAGPARLQFGPDGALYFAETRNHVVRRLGADGIITTVAGTGARGYSGYGGPATAAQLDTPYDLRFAPNGDLYIADSLNNVIRRVDAAGVIHTAVGDGQAGYGGDGGPAAAASLRRPSAVIFDADGSMWIADAANQRVRRVWRFLAPAS
jgi:hypothetical protein